MPKITAERLREFTATLQTYKAGKASLERRVVAAENWWKLRNRFEERKQGHGSPEGYQSESGWLHNVIVSKHADAMEAYPEPLILPREPGDQEEARLLSAILPCILEQNRFEKTYDAAMWQKLKTGTAAYRVVWDGEKLGGLGDIRIERVDLLNLFWEPGVADIQESRYLFCTHLEDEDLLQEQYPRLRGRLHTSPFRATRFVYDDAVDLSGKATVIEVYYKQRGVLHYCKYVGDTVLYATENGEESPPCLKGGGRAERGRGDTPAADYTSLVSPADGQNPPVTASPCQPPLGKGANEEAPTSAPAGLYAHGRYPFVLDPLFPVEGSPCGYGFVDLCANAQTAIDLMRTAFVKNTLVGATPRYFQRIDGSVNEEEFTDLTKPLVHVSGNLGEDSLRQIGFAGLPGVYVSVLESTIRELRETSGNTETANGTMNVGVTAASAIAALQEASGKGSRDATRASYAAFAEIVELCIELIRQFYTLPRQFRITGSRGMDFVQYSNARLLPREQSLCGESLGMTQPVFDVKVSAQKRSAYSRLSQNELAMQLYRLGLFAPGNEQAALGLLGMMEFDGKEQLEDRLEAEMGLREKLRQLEDYKALALALARRYRPDLAYGLEGDRQAGDPLSALRATSPIGGSIASPLGGGAEQSEAEGDAETNPPGASRHPPLGKGGNGEAADPELASRARAATAPLPG